MFSCLPFSTIRVWLDSLNLLSDTRSAVFGTAVKYFSIPMSVFSTESVLSFDTLCECFLAENIAFSFKYDFIGGFPGLVSEYSH